MILQKVKNETIRTSEYLADAPINLLEDEDLIGTGRLVQRIENIIEVIDVSQESYVIGVTGKWGSGKTSVLNTFSEKNKEKYHILHYSPRIYEDETSLYKKFFDELMNYDFNKDNIDSKDFCFFKKWRKKFLRFLKHGKLIAYIKKYIDQLNLTTNEPHLNILFFFVGIFIKFLKTDDIITFKKTISEKFSTLQKKIIVIIDDIDRLTPSKISSILQLVKSTANFSNIVYILSYDNELVEKGLKEIYKIDSYMDKIVQMEIHMPIIEKENLVNLFIETLEDIIKRKYPIRPKNNRIKRFLMNENGKKIIKNIRDIKRFSNLFHIDFELLHKNFSKPEINIFDFIGIELIKFYDEKFYKLIYDIYYEIFRKETTKNRIGDKLKYIKDHLSNQYDSRLSYLQLIFPINSNTISIEYTDSNSICNPENFDSYFILDILGLSNSEFEEFIEDLLSGSKETDTKFYNFLNKGQGKQFLKKIQYHIKKKQRTSNETKEQIIKIIVYILSKEDELRFKLDNPMDPYPHLVNDILLDIISIFFDIIFTQSISTQKTELFINYYINLLNSCNKNYCIEKIIIYIHNELYQNKDDLCAKFYNTIGNTIKNYTKEIVKSNLNNNLMKHINWENLLIYSLNDGYLIKEEMYNVLYKYQTLKEFILYWLDQYKNPHTSRNIQKDFSFYFDPSHYSEILKLYENDKETLYELKHVMQK